MAERVTGLFAYYNDITYTFIQNNNNNNSNNM